MIWSHAAATAYCHSPTSATAMPPHCCYFPALLQDDEIPPSGCTWLHSVLAIFGAHPKLGSLGLKIYQLNKQKDNDVEDRNVSRGEEGAQGMVAGCWWTDLHRAASIYVLPPLYCQVYFRDPAIGLDMQFTMLVDFAPMALLRAAFKHVGGLDEGMSEPGMCGICE